MSIMTSCRLNKEIRVIRPRLALSKEELRTIRKNDSIVYGIYDAIAVDSIKAANVRRRLDSFLLGNYNQKKLLTALKLEKVFGGNFEFDDNLIHIE